MLRMKASAPVASPPAQVPAAQASNVQRQQANLRYLRTAIRHKAVMVPAAGSGTTQAIAAAAMLPFDVQTANGGYLESILVEVAATVNPATGTAAAYALNAGAPWSLFDRIIVDVNGAQATIRPIFLKYLAMLGGYERSQPSQVNAGNNITALSNTIWGSPFPITVNTNNAWNFWFRIPLRMLPYSAAGMIPIAADSTKVQVRIQLTQNGLGADPLLFPVATTGGTGAAVTLGGTIKCLAEYRDGQNLLSPTNLALDLTGEPTVQWLLDRQINPLTAGNLIPQRFDNKLLHIYALSIIIDGVQSTSFALNSNIAGLQFDMDSSGNNSFFRYGVNGSNIGVNEYFEELRQIFGQDPGDQGVIPWIPGPAALGINPDNLEGYQRLQMAAKGWSDANYRVQVTTVNTANMTPRVETFLVSVNQAGLVRA